MKIHDAFVEHLKKLWQEAQDLGIKPSKLVGKEIELQKEWDKRTWDSNGIKPGSTVLKCTGCGSLYEAGSKCLICKITAGPYPVKKDQK